MLYSPYVSRSGAAAEALDSASPNLRVDRSIYLYLSLYVYIYMYIYLSIYLSICLPLSLSIYIYIYIHMYIYIYIHTYIPNGLHCVAYNLVVFYTVLHYDISQSRIHSDIHIHILRADRSSTARRMRVTRQSSPRPREARIEHHHTHSRNRRDTLRTTID